jgi:hypothetical protein
VRERRESGKGAVRLIIFGEGQETFLPRVMNVPRQCPLVFLVDVSLRKDEDIGSENVNFRLWTLS